MASVKKNIVPVKCTSNPKIVTNVPVKPTIDIHSAKKIMASKPDLHAAKKPSIVSSVKLETMSKTADKVDTAKSIKPSILMKLAPKTTTSAISLKPTSKPAGSTALKVDCKSSVVVKRVADSTTKPETGILASPIKPPAAKSSVLSNKTTVAMKSLTKTIPSPNTSANKTISGATNKISSTLAHKNPKTVVADAKAKSITANPLKSAILKPIVKTPASPRSSSITSTAIKTTLATSKQSIVAKSPLPTSKISNLTAKPKLSKVTKVAAKPVTAIKPSVVKAVNTRLASIVTEVPSKQISYASPTVKSIRTKRASVAATDAVKRLRDESEIEIRDADSTTGGEEEYEVIKDLDSMKLCTCDDSKKEVTTVDEQRVYLVAEQLFGVMQSEQLQGISSEVLNTTPAKSDDKPFIIDMSMIEMEEGRLKASCPSDKYKSLESIPESDEQENVSVQKEILIEVEPKETISSMPEEKLTSENGNIEIFAINETQHVDNVVKASKEIIAEPKHESKVIEQVIESLISIVENEEVLKEVEVLETTMITIEEHVIRKSTTAIEETEYTRLTTSVLENISKKETLVILEESIDVGVPGAPTETVVEDFAEVNLKNEPSEDSSVIVEIEAMVDDIFAPSVESITQEIKSVDENHTDDFSMDEIVNRSNTDVVLKDVVNESVTHQELISFDEEEMIKKCNEVEQVHLEVRPAKFSEDVERVTDDSVLIDSLLNENHCTPDTPVDQNYDFVADINNSETFDDISEASFESLSNAKILKTSAIEFEEHALCEEKIEDIQAPVSCFLPQEELINEDDEAQSIKESEFDKDSPTVQFLYDVQESDLVGNDENSNGQDHAHNEIDQDDVNFQKIMQKKNKRRNKKNRKSPASSNTGFHYQNNDELYNGNSFQEEFNGRRKNSRRWRNGKTHYQHGHYQSGREYYAGPHWKFS